MPITIKNIGHVVHHEDGLANIICFHHVGGDANIFRELSKSMRNFNILAVILPGRASSKSHELLQSMNELADGAASALVAKAREAPWLSHLPCLLVGHSMGGILAYETVLRLNSMRQPLFNVKHLVVSNVRSPECLTNKNTQAMAAPSNHPDWLVHRRDDEGLVDHVRSLGGASNVDESFLRAKLHAIRGDFKAFETYVSCNVLSNYRRVLDCEISAYYGTPDDKVPRVEVVDWSNHTTGSFHFTQFHGGGHFFLSSAENKASYHRHLSNLGHTMAEEARNNSSGSGHHNLATDGGSALHEHASDCASFDHGQHFRALQVQQRPECIPSNINGLVSALGPPAGLIMPPPSPEPLTLTSSPLSPHMMCCRVEPRMNVAAGTNGTATNLAYLSRLGPSLASVNPHHA